MGNSKDYLARAHAERIAKLEAQLKRPSLPPARRAELEARVRRLQSAS